MDEKEKEDLIYEAKVLRATAENQIKAAEDVVIGLKELEMQLKLDNLLVFQRVLYMSEKYGNDKAIEYVKEELENMKNEYEKSI